MAALLFASCCKSGFEFLDFPHSLIPAGLVTKIVHVNSAEMGTCPEGQLTVPQTLLAVRLPADILKPENKRSKTLGKNGRIGLEYPP